MHMPILNFQKDFTANGNVNIPVPRTNNLGDLQNFPFQIVPQKWALQVTGLTAADVAAAASAWTVNLVASLDGIVFSSTSLIVAHVGGVNANGEVAWQLTTSKTFYLARFAQVQLTNLTLGATATKLRISVIGDK